MLFEKIDKAMQKFDDARAQFIETEIDMGLTFCGVAQATSSPETRERNLENARKASSTAGESLQKATLSAGEKNRLHEKLAELNDTLEQEKRS